MGTVLSDPQRAWLDRTIGRYDVAADMSWDLTPSSVWHIRDGAGTSLIIKIASAEMRHHIAREIDAHEQVVSALSATGDAQSLIAADRDLSIMVLSYLPGSLVENTPAVHEPEMYRQAGGLLARIHSQGARLDDGYDRYQHERLYRLLGDTHRIPADQMERIRRVLASYTPRPVTVVPTHGDWHARNWLIDGSSLRVIDFGRFSWRPASTDFVRLAFFQPTLAAAHMDGYGADPRGRTWAMDCLREAVSIAVWAYHMGDEPFEQHGLAMIDYSLSLFSLDEGCSASITASP